MTTDGVRPGHDHANDAVGPGGAAQNSRRQLLRWAALAAGAVGASELLAACGNGDAASGERREAAAGSLRALVADAAQLSILGAQSLLPAGRSRFRSGLTGPTNVLVEGATGSGSPRTRPAERSGHSRPRGCS